MGLHLNEGGDDLAENHEINVTPFIDVMLVLLIIFMVAAPLATVDIKVDLPASTAKPAPRPEKPVFVSVKADQKLYVGDDMVAQPSQLGPMLDAKTKGDKETTIFFQADKGVDYGDLMEVMNNMRAAGYLKVGLVGLETAAKK
ncbi:TonB system transport protein ExbD [Pseudomonas shirazensis]|jgi:biopolymer transport protein ExbD|uniref:Biopolymer transport protein ExbD n=3 Tax=Pseudomonas TaxID=286 RepID=A0A2S3W836_PSEPU|nr:MULTISPECIES: TonB system transport protein ExbD [Pseudomonas]AUF98736.1 TonB system transport protein ExbD [Pseudomonas sp. 02C 26]MBA1197518.1 TonB system transport protein ExbD [Pseudomonas plecoglossicida]MBA1320418.1 TonB system transport protein ExbD [Pseudomonas plecoglossicida]MBO0366850.1 TonB system transport protein ExbD [Pseudomonas putida]MCS4284024.1 biopolymer transport protein ExbD [Pseudomonas sp. BIGb0278]